MCVDGPKRYLRGNLRRPLASSNSSPRVWPQALPLRWLFVLLFALSAPLQSSRIFPLCNCCPDQLHPLHLQQWTEKNINHIFEEDTLLFISLTPPAMGRQACPQSIDWWDYTLPCSIASPYPLHWLAVQQWSCVCSIRHNLYLFSSFWRVHVNF